MRKNKFLIYSLILGTNPYFSNKLVLIHNKDLKCPLSAMPLVPIMQNCVLHDSNINRVSPLFPPRDGHDRHTQLPISHVPYNIFMKPRFSVTL